MTGLVRFHSFPNTSEESGQVAQISVCLISALTVTDFIDAERTKRARSDTGAQLGVYTLAAVLREAGLHPAVINLDDLFLDFLRDHSDRDRQSKSFWEYVMALLREVDCKVFGFSSICSSYPLTLRLAAEIKRLHPESYVVLGGPQATVVDVATLKEFPEIDFVVRAEAEETFPFLLTRLAAGSGLAGLESMSGITFRRGEEVVRTPNGDVILDLDQLPLPAFDLDLGMKERGGVHIEIGRGCPFACTFCSTNDFFRRNFRLKSTPVMLDQMRYLHAQYGFSYFSFVHDMYTVDRKRVVDFCETLIASGEQFTWGCSARTDCVDPDLIALMARAGCRGIFYGIETGSQRLQEVINKKLDLAEAWRSIQVADEHGIDMAVALITGFPEETRDDLRDTMHFYVASLRMDHAEPQLSLLAPLAGTPVFEQHKHELIFDNIFSDMSHQGWWQDPTDLELIKAHPQIFPNFYAVPTQHIERTYFREVRDFVTYLSEWFRWLPVGLLQDCGDLLAVFDRWQTWLREKRAAIPVENAAGTPYYCQGQFRREFLEFVESCYLNEMASARAAIGTLVRMEGFSIAGDGVATPNDPIPFDRAAIPFLPPGQCLAELTVDYRDLIHCLKHNGNLRELQEQPSTIAFRLAPEGEVAVWQLPPLSACLMTMCDGRAAIEDIVGQFQAGEIDGIPSEKVALFGLMLLRDQGFISLSPRPAHSAEESSPTVSQYLLPPNPGTQQPWPPSPRADPHLRSC